MIDDFHSELSHYLKTKDKKNACKVILSELGKCLAKHKSDFVEVLNNAEIPASVGDSDIDLITKFTTEAPRNRTLLLGAAFLIHHKNKDTNFDGEPEVSDAGVKGTYKMLSSYFEGADEELSGADAGGWGSAVKELTNLGGKIYASESAKKQKREYGASDALQKQTAARKQMVQAIIDAKRGQGAGALSEKEKAAKTQKTLLIIGGAVIGLTIIGLIIYKIRKGK